MNAGFMCVGSHGTTQIDQDWINMVFVQKGTLNFNGQTAPAQGALSVSYTGESPIIFLRTGTLYIYPMNVKRVGNVWTWSFCALGPSGEGIETATYYIFDKQPNVETHCGLNVYDGNGRVTFNSDYYPMRIAAIIPAPFAYGAPAVNQVVSAGSGVYAASLTSPGFESHLIQSNIGVISYQGYRLSGGNTFQTNVNTVTGPPLQGGIGGGMGIVVDVGGL